MINAILRGMSDAGSPQVWFDEGDVASTKPRCGSLKRAVGLLLVAWAMTSGAVTLLDEVDALEYTAQGVRCQLTWTGPKTGWRLRTAGRNGSFEEAGAVQKLAAFMQEPPPSSAQTFRVCDDGHRAVAQDGTQVILSPQGALGVYSASGKPVTEIEGVRCGEGRTILRGLFKGNEPVYGLGQRLDRLNKRGQRLLLYTADGYNNSNSTYMAIPLFTTHRGGGVFVNLYEKMTADFGATETNAWEIAVDRPSLDVYLFAKDRIEDALSAYTDLSGHADFPERWSQGPIVCRYHPDLTRLEGPFACDFRGVTLRGHGLREIVDRHEALGVKPTAVIVEGGRFVSAPSDPNRLAELRKMSDYLRAKDVKLMLYMRCGSVCDTKAEGFSPAFNVAVSIATNGAMAVANTRLVPDLKSTGINPDVGKAHVAHEVADITDPAFWDWYVNVVWKRLVDLGVRGVKIDFCEMLPEEGMNAGGVEVHYKWKDPSVFAGTAVHHAYPTFFISRFYRALNKLTKGRGGFMVLSRGGGIGSQRNPYLWAGDQRRVFEKLDDQLLAVLNSGMSGVPFMTYDMAGYQYERPCIVPDGTIDGKAVFARRSRMTDETMEAAVFRRGVAFTAFMPCVQSHGFVRNAYEFDEQTRCHYRKYMAIHAKLRNRIVDLCREAAEKGVPPVRPLVLAYPDDPKTWDIADEFLLGDSILVAPAFAEAPRTDFYLPAGDWKRLQDLDIPVFVRGDLCL